MTTAGVKRPFASSAGSDAFEVAKPKLKSIRHEEASSVTPPSRIDSLSPPSGKVPGFRHDATLVLVGLRGSGKSTLAVMASTALNRIVIDLEAAFQRAHGVTSSSYRKSHGSEDGQLQQAEILRDVLKHNATGRILVCSWIDQQVRSLLREFAMTNPVVHIVRDAEAIKAHLRVDNDQKVESLLAFATPFFRECSSFEFFNITEKSLPATESAPLQSAFIPSLTLKRTETHFTKFLSLLYPVGTIPFVDSAFPLASVPLEQRQFTYIIPLAMSDILSAVFDIEEAICGADAVQVTVDIPDVDDSSDNGVATSTLAAQITRAVAIVRRSTVLPIICHLRVHGAAGASTWDVYMKLIVHAFKLAPEMVTIDLRLDIDNMKRALRSRYRSKVMGCYETFSRAEPWSSQYWRALYKKAVDVGCDTARLTRPATSPRDNIEVAQFRAKLETGPDGRIPAAAYNSGPIGRTSACFNSLLTVTTTAPASEMAKETVIDQAITPMQATAALFASFIYEPMKLYVFGAKVDYSMSPIMHNSALEAYGMPHD
ncbi:hypothetical protein NQ176_g8527 [Zarea fungicola]|uniref:Uncharacterized protein n=1 Tax=Zarea fungicola TaxID=93591 RepID=A0ACC1MT81_9HYPO|nr:hypothetical protein NQ176_g8527 [Lecanicillium fungicola]